MKLHESGLKIGASNDIWVTGGSAIRQLALR
jgi:hypothetical protein